MQGRMFFLFLNIIMLISCWHVHSRDIKTQHIQFEILEEYLSLFYCDLIQLNFVLNMYLIGDICINVNKKWGILGVKKF